MAVQLNENAQKCVRWTIFSLSVICFVFACVSVGHCTFVDAGVDGDRLGDGLFSTQLDGDLCVAYSDDAKDAFGGIEKAARAFGVMAALFTGVAMVLAVSIQFCLTVASRPLWLAVRMLYIAAFVAQVLTFMIFGSDILCESEFNDDFGCNLGAAGIVSVLNIFGLLTLSVISWLIPPPEHPILIVKLYSQEQSANINKTKDDEAPVELPAEPEETTKITYEDGPDGQRTITKEVTHPDGSKTITTTVEEVDVPVIAQSSQQQQDYNYDGEPLPQYSNVRHAGRYGEE